MSLGYLRSPNLGFTHFVMAGEEIVRIHSIQTGRGDGSLTSHTIRVQLQLT
jgi:hypothetical protein